MDIGLVNLARAMSPIGQICVDRMVEKIISMTQRPDDVDYMKDVAEDIQMTTRRLSASCLATHITDTHLAAIKIKLADKSSPKILHTSAKHRVFA